MKLKTCFKSIVHEGSCIDLILSNKNKSFQNTGTVDTGLSDCHHLIHTMFKTQFVKLPPKKLKYRCFKSFNEAAFLTELSNNLSEINNYSIFEGIFTNILDKHAPLKEKVLRSNNKEHVTKH